MSQRVLLYVKVSRFYEKVHNFANIGGYATTLIYACLKIHNSTCLTCIPQNLKFWPSCNNKFNLLTSFLFPFPQHELTPITAHVCTKTHKYTRMHANLAIVVQILLSRS